MMFQQHAAETKSQYERLIRRLEQLGQSAGAGVTFKSVLAHLAGITHAHKVLHPLRNILFKLNTEQSPSGQEQAEGLRIFWFP